MTIWKMFCSLRARRSGTLAHTNKDRDLAALVEVTPSSLDHLGEQELSNRATIVLAAATARKTELAALQVTQANLDELDQALQDFNASKEGPAPGDDRAHGPDGITAAVDP